MHKSGKYSLSLKKYRDFFVEFYTPLCLFANKYLDNLELSRDLVQDVFLKIWEDKIEFRGEEHIKSFLYVSVRNKCLDHLKSKRHLTTDALDDKTIEKLEGEAYFLREVVVQEASGIVEKAINTLPEQCARVVRLSLQSLTNAEIAEEMGVSINTVKTQKKIAYKRLRPLLDKYYILLLSIALWGNA
ncbi:RNA polymerase sigma-70 factor [Sinomicrobium sp.]